MKKSILLLLIILLSSCSAKKVIKEKEIVKEEIKESVNIKVTESVFTDDKTKTITITETIEPINPAIESIHNGKPFKNSKLTKVTIQQNNDVKTTENAVKEIEAVKEVKTESKTVKTEKQKIRFNWWWLLLLLIPLGWWGYRKIKI